MPLLEKTGYKFDVANFHQEVFKELKITFIDLR